MPHIRIHIKHIDQSGARTCEKRNKRTAKTAKILRASSKKSRQNSGDRQTISGKKRKAQEMPAPFIISTN